jgi:hypothetical protein
MEASGSAREITAGQVAPANGHSILTPQVPSSKTRLSLSFFLSLETKGRLLRWARGSTVPKPVSDGRLTRDPFSGFYGSS